MSNEIITISHSCLQILILAVFSLSWFIKNNVFTLNGCAIWKCTSQYLVSKLIYYFSEKFNTNFSCGHISSAYGHYSSAGDPR